MSVRSLLMAAAGASTPAPAYRYWRIYITALNAGGTQVGIVEVELRTTAGGADQTTSATPVLESSYAVAEDTSYYPGACTIDGDTSSYWVSASYTPPPHFVRYDLITQKAIVQVAIYPYPSSLNCPRDFKIQGSNDGVNFTDVKSFTSVAAWYGWQVFNL